MMDCREIQDELLLSFGTAPLEADLAEHLEGCPDCRAFWAELTQTGAIVPDGTAFEPSASERAALLSAINKDLEAAPAAVARPHWPWWSRALQWVVPVPAPVVAAAVVVLAVVSLFTGLNRTSPSDSTPLLSPESATTSDTLTEELMQPDQPTVEALVERYSSSRPTGGAEELLNDLTDDEYEYLVNHFDVGDIM